MGFLDKFRPAIDKAKEKAQDPAFQAKVKEQAQKQLERRRQGQRRAFTGGGPDTPGYPWPAGHPMHGHHAHPGFYDDDGQWHDSDGDGVPDAYDADPNDPNVQSQSDVDPDGGFDSDDGSTQYDDSGYDDGGGYDGGYDGGDDGGGE